MSRDPRTLVIPDGTEIIKTNQYRKANYEQVFIPKSVTEIQSRAFDECRNLREVVFEEGSKLRIIGDNAFDSCENLAKINLPEGLQSIE